MDNGSAEYVIARYFEMWNTGDTAIADEVLHPDWVDHAHPEVAGPADVKRAVDDFRAGRPGLCFTVHRVLGDDDLVAVAGSVGPQGRPADPPGHLVWLVRLRDGLMSELWTYQQSRPTR